MMSKVLYEASPSMVRMNPFGTVLAILILVSGIFLAVAGKTLATNLGIPVEDNRVAATPGILLAVIAFLRLISWWIASKVDHLVIQEDEIVWTHGLINKQYTEIHLGSVRTVRVRQGILQRIMDAGDVTIFSTGDVPELAVKGLPNPGAIRRLIRSEV